MSASQLVFFVVWLAAAMAGAALLVWAWPKVWPKAWSAPTRAEGRDN